MQPYPYQGTGVRVHPHNTCEACTGHPRTKSTTRFMAKKSIINEFNEGYHFLDSILDDFPNIWDEDCDWDYYWKWIKRVCK